MFVTNDKSAEVLEPAVGALDLPSSLVPAERATVLRFGSLSVRPVRTDQLDAPRLQARSKRITVRGRIVDQSIQPLPQLSMFEQRLDQLDVVMRGAVDVGGKGSSARVNENHDFGSFAALGFADVGAPLFALENVPSARASSRSIFPRPSSCRRHRCQARWNTPDSVHSCNLRQQVAGDGNDLGKSCQRAPVRRIQRMPSRQGRGSTRGRPPAREGGSQGKRSAMRNHCSSVSCDLGSVLEAPLYWPAEGHQWNFKSMCVPPFTRTCTQLACQSIVQ